MEFNKINFSDMETLRKHTRLAHTRNCEYAMVNIFFWNDTDKLMFAVIDDVLVYRLIDAGTTYYSIVEFIEEPAELVMKLEQDAVDNGCRMVLTNMSENMVLRLEREMVGQLRYWYDREYSDYIYEVDDLIRLSGSKYHGKKNHLNY